jgi:spore maturation protein CgeB
MKILYTGPCRPGSITEARRQGLIELGHDVVALDQVPYVFGGPWPLGKAQSHLLIGPGIVAYNRALRRLAASARFDIIYVDQAVYLWPRTVRALRATGARVVHYTSEYFWFRPYLYRHLFRTADLFDVHVVTNSIVVSYLRAQTRSRIVVTEFGYDPRYHRPILLTEAERRAYDTDAVFVGHWEPATEAMIAALRRGGVAAKVWGPGWHRARSLDDRAQITTIRGDEYIKLLLASRICLCFLSKWNHNESAGRTFEIPAVGSFLLAERTPQQASYFEEGREAAFFGSADELVVKARHYLARPDERAAVAEAGHERCLKSPYRHVDRMRQIMDAIA